MQEIRCRQCGAIFTAHHEGTACPFCGAEPGVKLGAVLSFLGRYWILVLGILLLLVVSRPSKQAWMWIGLLSIIGALGFACFFFWRAKQTKSNEQPISLGLGPPAKARPDPWSVPLSPPKVPDKWRTLVESRPPRDVYVPPKVWWGFFGETLSVIIILFGELVGADRHHVSPLHFFWSRPDVGLLVIVLPYMATVGARIKSFLATRNLMRDGEVTIAYTIDSSHGRATYQFWTKTGQSFQRRARVIKRPDFATGPGLVPVFYLPENPQQSVPLYGTEFSVRLPEPAAVSLRKAPARA